MLLATTWALTLHLIRAATRVSCVLAFAVSLTQNKGQVFPMLPAPPSTTQPLCWPPWELSRNRHLCPANTGHARLRALRQLVSQSRSLCPHTCAYFLLTYSTSWYESSLNSRSLPRFSRVKQNRATLSNSASFSRRHHVCVPVSVSTASPTSVNSVSTGVCCISSCTSRP